jgi:hypothetical protein
VQADPGTYSNEITGAERGNSNATKAFIKPGQSFCESIKDQENSLIFSGRGVFSLDPPFNG